MSQDPSKLKRAVGLLLVVVLPVLGASIPVLDVMPEDWRAGVESEHHPGTHGLPHNHLICIQQAANQWVQACGSTSALVAMEVPLPPDPEPAPPHHGNHSILPRSRAPPLI